MSSDEIFPSTLAAAFDSSSDERYRPLFALSPQPAWVYDRETLRFLEVNEAAVHAYGWSRSEFLAMTIRDIRPPSEQSELTRLVEATRGAGLHAATALHRTKAGHIRRVELSSYPLEFEGTSARMVLVHDVTEHFATQEALVRSEEKYRSVIEQLQDVFFRMDEEGRWTFLNSAWTALTGYLVDESIGTSYLTYVHPSDRTALLDASRTFAQGTPRAVLEVRYFRRDGGHRWVEASLHAVRTDDGQLAGAMGTLRDVTDRRAADQERERLSTNIRQLLDASGEGIYGLDARGLVTFVNRRGSEMLGYAAEELVGKDMHQLTHHTRGDGSPYPLADCPIHLAATKGIACEIDDELMWRKDGTPLMAEYAASPIREQGRLSGTVVNFRDITSRKRAEAELIEARDAAQAANSAKSDFLARMSHELRTPLNSIIGFANVLLKNKHGTLRDNELSYLGRINTNGRHLLGLINDILDLSKIEAGRMTLDIAPVLLGQLILATLDELESQTRDKEVVLRADLPEIELPLDSDAVRVKQVLINLVGNAIKFTEQGEVVVTLLADDAGVPLAIRVRDSGIGIPPDRLDAIFNVFEQAESMTARRYGGTGLGLAISRSLCTLMGHRLEVESVIDQGTTMTVRLGASERSGRITTPLDSRVIPEEPPLPAIRQGRVPKPVILIIDDDPDATELLRNIVEEAGCRCVSASTGIDGLQVARELLPALIFLDLRLPKISGFDVLRILNNDDALKHTPVVIASVIGTESRSSLAGAAAILDMPLDRDLTLGVIRRWIPSPLR